MMRLKIIDSSVFIYSGVGDGLLNYIASKYSNGVFLIIAQKHEYLNFCVYVKKLNSKEFFVITDKEYPHLTEEILSEKMGRDNARALIAYYRAMEGEIELAMKKIR